jgi:hypothetical protein
VKTGLTNRRIRCFPQARLVRGTSRAIVSTDHLNVMRTFVFCVFLSLVPLVRASEPASWTRNSFIYVRGKTLEFVVTSERVAKTPIWEPGADSPPLAARKADNLALAEFRKLNLEDKNFVRDRITLEDTGDGLHWIYVVGFKYMGITAGFRYPVEMFVLMDGTVVEPIISETK